MKIQAVVISYNTCDLLRNCLRSLFAHPPACEWVVTIVDNSSADDSVAMVRAEFPQARVIANEANLGYAAAINQVLQGLPADYALILNSDLVIPAGALDALLQYAQSHPQAAMVAPRLTLPDGSVQPTWRGGFTLGWFAAQQFLPDKLLRRSHLSNTSEEAALVEHLDGAALLVRADALREVGLMDEGYWMYCEDSDWCLRFRRAGWQLSYLPCAQMLHHHGASSRHVRGEMIASYNLAAARYFRLHHGALEGWLARTLGLAGTSLRLLGSLVGAILTAGQYEPLTSRARLFARALSLQSTWRRRWLRPPAVPSSNGS